MASLKRETSVSVTDLHEQLSDSVKRISLRSGDSAPSPTLSPLGDREKRAASVAMPGPELSTALFKLIDEKASSSEGGTSSRGSSLYEPPNPNPNPSSGGSYDEVNAAPSPYAGISSIDSNDSAGSFTDLRQTDRNSSAESVPHRQLSQEGTQGTVLDKLSDKDAFLSKYEVIKEIGRGGFSKVYQCQDLQTRRDYAVKVIDLRPLRLREGFDPTRLRREVDIMSRLQHANIVGFVEGFETEEQVLMVLEHCPGKELFDVILERKSFSEADAKVVFAQIAKALFYLHSLNIIHRDIKPENILVLDQRDTRGDLVVKLLDFGLSKNAGAGSEAKTFVGTPCYLSPEVEHTSKGLGGTYGLPADCWSLGAVLYVMLVARFPEFKQDAATKKIVLKLPGVLWSGISAAAKELVSSLMDTNQHTRMASAGTLLHPWLHPHGCTPRELDETAQACRGLCEGLQANLYESEKSADGEESLTPGGFQLQQTEMVLRARQPPMEASAAGQHATDDQLQLSPLFQLQRNVATCFADAHASYQDIPEVATQVRQGAVLCRQQFTESTKMLYKIEQTAAAVLGMFPDLELAVEEGEPQLAGEFFALVKDWVVELRSQVSATQLANQASMAQIQSIVESSTLSLQNRITGKLPQSVKVPRTVLNLVQKRLTGGSSKDPLFSSGNSDSDDEAVKLSGEQVMELFMGLFSGPPGGIGGRSPSKAAERGSGAGGSHGDDASADDSVHIDTSEYQTVGDPHARARSRSSSGASSSSERSGSLSLHNTSNTSASVIMEDVSMDEGDIDTTMPSASSGWDCGPGVAKGSGLGGDGGGLGMLKDGPRLMIHDPSDGEAETSQVGLGSPVAASRLQDALQHLRQVDMILEQLSAFWANTELVLDVRVSLCLSLPVSLSLSLSLYFFLSYSALCESLPFPPSHTD